MASPIATPPLPPQRRHTPVGAVLLIGIGVLLLLVNMGVLHMREVFPVFAKYWPLLIILFGLAKMYDFYQARHAGYSPRGIGAGTIILLIFLVLIGSATTAAYHHMDDVNWGQVRENIQIGDEDLGSFMGQRFEFNDAAPAQDFPANGKLTVVSDRGDIRVTVSPDNKIHVNTHTLVYSTSQDKARAESQSLLPQFKTEATLLTIDASHRNGANGRADLEIQIPRKAAVDLMTLRGTIQVTGRDGDVKAHNSRGDVSLQDIAGNNEVHLRGGNFSAKDVHGDISLEGRVDDANITNVSGTLSLAGDYLGTVQLSKVSKAVRFKSSRTDMEFARLDGDLTMETGDLRANSLVGPLRLATRSKDIHLEGVSGDIHVEDANAAVELHPKSPLGNVEVTSHRGNVQVFLPPNANYQVDARAAHGTVENDFDLKVEDSHGDARATGNIGKGDSRLNLTNDRGEISIRKG